jgi:carboxymethylenebutenolidase
MKFETTGQMIDIPKKDGTCDAFIAEPNLPGKYPGVLFLMDGFGVRPYLKEMALKLAGEGFIVLEPNLLYRVRRSPVLSVKFPVTLETLPQARAELIPIVKSYDPAKGLDDIEFFLDHLAKNKNFNGKIGITGYCMGGSLAIKAAARFSNHIQAVASFHGGNLATESAGSPYLLLPQIKAMLYVAHADKDASMPPEQIDRFEKAVISAGINAKVELYQSAMHGFTMMDLPAYNPQALSRHWTELLSLFSSLK